MLGASEHDTPLQVWRLEGSDVASCGGLAASALALGIQSRDRAARSNRGPAHA